MNLLSTHNRKYLIDQLSSQDWDLLIIGGGITGAGIALDAASRGMKTVLVEKNDFASGTSSRSTKLIHGGLRYLKQFEIGLVREVGLERAVLHSLAPHLVKSEKMLLPIIKHGNLGKIGTSLGLKVYDILAGVEKDDQRKMLSKEQTLECEPLLPAEILEGGAIYSEYRTDDARLTIEVLKTAAEFGAIMGNYLEVEGFDYENGKIRAAFCRDNLNQQTFSIKAKFIVNAAGAWVDQLRTQDQSLDHKRLVLSKGVHIVVPHERFPIKQALYFDVPDGRMVFAIPRGKITYVGTTDTPYEGKPENVCVEKKDVDYLIEGVNHIFKTVHLEVKDVVSSWAGLRPLIYEKGKSSSELSRKDEIFVSKTGLISIAGGKLTGFRKMAERIVNKINAKYSERYQKKFRKCWTDQIPLCGGVFKNSISLQNYTEKIKDLLKPLQLSSQVADYLVSNYGKQSELIILKAHEYKTWDSGLALAKAELWFGIENEWVVFPMDFFNRRTGKLYFDIENLKKILVPILTDMKNEFGWTEEKYLQELQNGQKAIQEVTSFEQ